MKGVIMVTMVKKLHRTTFPSVIAADRLDWSKHSENIMNVTGPGPTENPMK